MSSMLVSGGQVLDVATGELHEHDVLAVDGRIVEVGPDVRAPDGAEVIDARGLVVMPGLIDAHVHVTAATADLSAIEHVAGQLRHCARRNHPARHAASGLHHRTRCLRRRLRAREGAGRGPARRAADRFLWQGAEPDRRPRRRTRPRPDSHGGHPLLLGLGRIADGVDAVRVAARDELRKGAHHIKVMASGGVASPTDRIDSTQYSDAELVAASRRPGPPTVTSPPTPTPPAQSTKPCARASGRSNTATSSTTRAWRCSATRRLPRPDAGDLLGTQGGRHLARAARVELGEGGRGPRRGARGTRACPRRRSQDRLWLGPARRHAPAPVARVPHPWSGPATGRRHQVGHPGRRRPARHERRDRPTPARAPEPTCCFSTATRSPTSPCSPNPPITSSPSCRTGPSWSTGGDNHARVRRALPPARPREVVGERTEGAFEARW